MKKLLAIILALTFVLSLAACGKDNKPKSTADKSNETVSDVVPVDTNTELETQNNETTKDKTDEVLSEKTSPEKTTSNISFEDVSSFDDFVEKVDKSGFKTTLTENKDGSLTVSLDTSKNDDKTAKPAIPTIDKIKEQVKPEETVKPDKTTKPDESQNEEKAENNEEKTENNEEKTQEESNPATEIKPTVTEKEQEKKPTYTYTTNQKHTKLHYTERYLYSILDEEKKDWYRSIDEAVTNLERTAKITGDIGANRNYFIYFLYMFDNPEHFYLSNQTAIIRNGDSDSYLGLYYSVGSNKGDYHEYRDGPVPQELKDKIIAKKQTFEKEANRILSTIPANAPDVWKERLIYDRILMDSHYNLGAKWDGRAEDNWTAYGILVNKAGVCESYSEAFQTLCLYAGINCTGVIGTAGGGHKWNCVELDGEWYMCDITFDDPIGNEAGDAYHFYFNRTSDWFIEYDHDWSDCDYNVPECNGTKYDFEKYFDDSRW